MSVGEYTVSNIAMDEDKREEENNRKKSTIDLEAVRRDIASKKELARAGQLHAAVEGLLALEKNGRQAEDITATKESCVAILEVCYEAKDWTALEENITLLAKRRSQLKQVVQAFVRQAITYIDAAPDNDTKVRYIKTLLAVTEGKIYVEIERARLTRKLAALKEEEGNVAEAADILQECAVETFGAMAKTEKIAFILDQVRLCLERADFVRAHILSKKISPRAFVERRGEGQGDIGIEGTAIEAAAEGTPKLPELKRQYYELMIRYHAHDKNYLEICRCYRAIYDGEEDDEQAKQVLARLCWFVVLAPRYSTAAGAASDRATLLANARADRRLGDLPVYAQLLRTFSTEEIVRWSVFSVEYAGEIAGAAGVFDGQYGDERRKDLQLRVCEHNLLVVARYYTRCSVARLAQLLDLGEEEAEAQLSELVVRGAVDAKIDRPAGVVAFGARRSADDVLNAWSGKIASLLELVEKSCQLIQKEAMVHKLQLSAA